MHTETFKEWKQFVKSMWKNFKSRFESILSSLGRHKQFLDECINVAHYQTTKAHYDASASQHKIYRADIETIKTKLDQTIAEEEMKKLNAVRAWLAPGQQQYTDHEKISTDRKASPNTAQWILENDYIKRWLNEDIVSDPLGWVTGIPGAGLLVDLNYLCYVV